MTRKAARKLLAASAAGFVAALSAGEAAAQAPNVLVIVTDDQRAGTTSIMPKTRKWFWSGGRVFPRAYASTPLCCPARASLFTGLFAHNHGVKNNGTSAMPQSVSVQRYLHGAGYTTALVGKYLNSWRHTRNPPHFDRWVMSHRNPYFDAVFNIDGELRTLEGYVTKVMASRSVGLLRSFEADDERPWFLYIAPHAPHQPAIPAPRYQNAPVPSWRQNPAVRESDRSDKPPWVRTRSASATAVQALRADQLRTLLSVDNLVEKVFDELGALRERRETLAFYLSDNGYLWREHGMTEKRHPYTESIRIPLAMRWPGHVARDSTDWRFITTVDIAPTILAAAGVVPATPMDGRSLVDGWTRRRAFIEYWRDVHYQFIPSWDAIRTRRLHYIQYYNEDRTRVIFREYYRLDRDPWELHNLLHDGKRSNNPGTDWLRRLIQQYKNCSAATCP
jgi:arylsulfatase A-like enzyme